MSVPCGLTGAGLQIVGRGLRENPVLGAAAYAAARPAHFARPNVTAAGASA
jgi:Asp-tRNA(Asn)/Glu-tRNA(Gln) amidotransferase A subunit family amidase